MGKRPNKVASAPKAKAKLSNRSFSLVSEVLAQDEAPQGNDTVVANDVDSRALDAIKHKVPEHDLSRVLAMVIDNRTLMDDVKELQASGHLRLGTKAWTPLYAKWKIGVNPMRNVPNPDPEAEQPAILVDAILGLLSDNRCLKAEAFHMLEAFLDDSERLPPAIVWGILNTVFMLPADECGYQSKCLVLVFNWLARKERYKQVSDVFKAVVSFLDSALAAQWWKESKKMTWKTFAMTHRHMLLAMGLAESDFQTCIEEEDRDWLKMKDAVDRLSKGSATSKALVKHLRSKADYAGFRANIKNMIFHLRAGRDSDEHIELYKAECKKEVDILCNGASTFWKNGIKGNFDHWEKSCALTFQDVNQEWKFPLSSVRREKAILLGWVRPFIFEKVLFDVQEQSSQRMLPEDLADWYAAREQAFDILGPKKDSMINIITKLGGECKRLSKTDRQWPLFQAWLQQHSISCLNAKYQEMIFAILPNIRLHTTPTYTQAATQLEGIRTHDIWPLLSSIAQRWLIDLCDFLRGVAKGASALLKPEFNDAFWKKVQSVMPDFYELEVKETHASGSRIKTYRGKIGMDTALRDMQESNEQSIVMELKNVQRLEPFKFLFSQDQVDILRTAVFLAANPRIPTVLPGLISIGDSEAPVPIAATEPAISMANSSTIVPAPLMAAPAKSSRPKQAKKTSEATSRAVSREKVLAMLQGQV